MDSVLRNWLCLLSAEFYVKKATRLLIYSFVSTETKLLSSTTNHSKVLVITEQQNREPL